MIPFAITLFRKQSTTIVRSTSSSGTPRNLSLLLRRLRCVATTRYFDSAAHEPSYRNVVVNDTTRFRSNNVAFFSTKTAPALTSPSLSLSSSLSYNDNNKSNQKDTGLPHRTAISIVGAVNAGKSVLMNLLTQSDVSLVHNTAGTTADPKPCVMELHGRIGPVKLLDTPGINETGELGQLKRQRAFQTIGNCDIAVVVVDPFLFLEEKDAKKMSSHTTNSTTTHTATSTVERQESWSSSVACVVDLLQQVEHRQQMNLAAAGAAAVSKKQQQQHPLPLIIYNLRVAKVQELEQRGGSVTQLLEDFETAVLQQLKCGSKDKGSAAAAAVTFPPTLAVDFTAHDKASRDRVITFLETYANPRLASDVSVIPDWLLMPSQQQQQQQNVTAVNLENDYCLNSPNVHKTVFLNIPMDPQTPRFRLLRPQALVQEALLRNYVSTVCYRMNLQLARSPIASERQFEEDRFRRAIEPYLTNDDDNLCLLITDSQAMDVVAPWTLDDGHELVPITTFSIAMIRYLSGGRLNYFVDGLRKLKDMCDHAITPVAGIGQPWRILISEACNHTRLTLEKQCADIGTVQIPNHLASILSSSSSSGNNKNGVEFEFAFGKHNVMFDPTRFDLVVHCGGCMLTPQEMDGRLADIISAGVAVTNYGLLLSYLQSPQTLERVLQPWGISYDQATPTFQELSLKAPVPDFEGV